jgi:hypothetical protein
MRVAGGTRRHVAAMTLFAAGTLTSIGGLYVGGASGAPLLQQEVGTTVGLNPSHVGATNPGFSPAKTDAPGDGCWWHFIAPGSEFLTLTVVFEDAGTITYDSPAEFGPPSLQHAWVPTPGPDTLLSGTATIDGGASQFVLSHIQACEPPDTTQPSSSSVPGSSSTTPTTTATTMPSTTAPSTTAPSTTAPSTTTPSTTTASTTTASTSTTTATSVAGSSTTVLGTLQTITSVESVTSQLSVVSVSPSVAPTQSVGSGTLPRTGGGAGDLRLVALGLGMVAAGALLHTQRNAPYQPRHRRRS